MIQTPGYEMSELHWSVAHPADAGELLALWKTHTYGVRSEVKYVNMVAGDSKRNTQRECVFPLQRYIELKKMYDMEAGGLVAERN